MTEPATQASPAVSTAQPEDFFQLLKPRVMSLVIFTAVTGLVVAGGNLDWLSSAIAILCIAVGAGAAGALNMALEGETAALMREAQELEAAGKVRSAVRVYRRAAAQGNGQAAKLLGDIYANGRGDQGRDYAESLRWYGIAEKLGVKPDWAGGRG